MFDRDQLVGSLDRLHAEACRVSVALLESVAAMDEGGMWSEDGATSMTAWLAGRYALTRATATEWVRVARALRRLPSIKAAYRMGRLSWDQLRPLTRFATEDTDQAWAERGPELTAAGLWIEARRHERETRKRAEQAARMRSVRMGWDEEKRFLYVEARLPTEQGEAFEQRVEQRAQEMALDPEAWDPHEARQADALVELVCSEATGSTTPILVIHTDASVLTSEGDGVTPRLAETESGVRVADESVRRLACDAKVEWLTKLPGGTVGIGRASRSVPPWLLRRLRHRDQGRCRFPGCGHRRWLKAHHLVHWARGGPTDLDNLVLLCHTHHRLVHEGGWSIRGSPSGTLRFHDPTGRPLPLGPARVAA